jgi:hypothetical protein
VTPEAYGVRYSRDCGILCSFSLAELLTCDYCRLISVFRSPGSSP